MFFFPFIDICVVSREVNMYDLPNHHINNWDKVLRGKTTVSMLSEIGFAAYQRMSVEVLVFRIPSETYSLLNSGGEWEPFVIANCPAVYRDLVGLDTCGTLDPLDGFTEAGSATHRLPSPTFEPDGPLV